MLYGRLEWAITVLPQLWMEDGVFVIQIMKNLWKIGLCLMSGLMYAYADSSPADNPYIHIVARNVFNLNVRTVEPPAQVTAPQLPKITLDGYMTGLKPYLLFKISSPATSTSNASLETRYVLGEGEQVNDVKLIRFDAHAGVAIIQAHGIQQEISLSSR